MIIGNQQAIKLAKESKPGNPSVLVSLEALENLPDLYDAQITQVDFVPPVSDDKPGDFSPVGGGKYMPSVDLMNRMSEARGISGMDMAVVEPLYEDIDWNIMTRNDKDPPKLVRYLVGYRCTKQGRVLAEDGTERISDPCTVNYNAWERVCELFSKEEMYSNGYAKPGKYPFKYDTMLKRRNAFASEMKFAERKADSKARNVVIRTLCGMPTGYDTESLKLGYFVIGKIIRSAWAVKSEHAARLQALSQGIGDQSASKLLYGPAKTEPVPPADEPAPTQTNSDQPLQYTVVDQDLASQALDAEQPMTQAVMIKALSQYKTSNLIPADMTGSIDKLLVWLNGTQNAESNASYWAMALSRLAAVEEKIPKELQVR